MVCGCRLLTLPLLLIGVVAAMTAKAEDAKSEKTSGEKRSVVTATRPAVRVTISKETTYITEPLRPDGYPDYVAALNQRASKGVTPENNAAVLFWKAMGPGKIDEKDRTKYFEMLGMELLPEKGDYFIDYDDFLKKKQGERPSSVIPPSDGCDPLQDQYTTAQERPWSKEEFPEVYEWLAANEKPLALLIEASKRSRRYDPMVSDDKTIMIAVLMPAIQPFHGVARALTIRAMLLVHNGKTDKAWENLLACHRLARLVGEGQTVIDVLVATGIDGITCAKDHALLQHAKPSATQIAKMRDDLNRLPPIPRMADRIDVAERFTYLDCVSAIAREGPCALSEVTIGGKPNSIVASLMDSIGGVMIDWNIAMRMGNSWYDRFNAAYRKPILVEQKRALDSIDADIRKLTKLARDLKSLGLSAVGNPRKAVSEQVGQAFVCLLLPGISACANAENRGNVQFELNKLAFALAAYRVDHGSYPAKLEELRPKYVAEVPRDIFANDGPLHYDVKDGGYLLYSVGVNGRDDGGKRIEDCDAEKPEGWDDLVVRMKGK